MAEGQLTEEQRKEWEEKVKNMSPEELRELQRKQCIFCQIISGKVPSKKVYEDDKCLAVLDINPAAKGHLLIIPKEHFAVMPQVSSSLLGHLFIVSKALSQLILRVLKISGTTIFVANGLAAGQRAPHFLIHLIPRKEGDNLLQAEEKIISKEMQEKVRSVVGKRLDEILGVRKQPTLKEFEKKEPEKKIKVAEMPEAEPEPQSQESEEKPNIAEEKSEQLKETKKTRKKKEKDNSKKRKSLSKKAKEPEDNEEAEVTKKEKVSLDDIANLFK